MYFRCTDTVEEPPACNNENELKTNAYCGLIQDRRASNPFYNCIIKADSSYAVFMDACVYDACVIKNSTCNSLSAFAENCEDLDVIVAWRHQNRCRK